MRTTVIIDDALLRRAKAHAAREGLSLSDLIDQALRDVLQARPSVAGEFHMPTYGRPGAGVRHEPADFAAALADEDAVPRRGR
ncbi:MAG TPA: DUF2191 domain-containing protein [Polyangia bacterium]|jgi:hypothetical protein